jgi:hypothetical protein
VCRGGTFPALSENQFGTDRVCAVVSGKRVDRSVLIRYIGHADATLLFPLILILLRALL